MTTDKFNEIIDFAVAREEEAVKFYHDLQERVKFAAQIEMLKELEDMEKGHISVLESIRERGLGKLQSKEVTDLKISDYLVKVEPSSNMSYQDILIVAMKREEASQRLYLEMSARFSGTEGEPLFARLAAEEGQHKLRFEKLYDEEVLRDN